jgi:pyruvate formate lyase activating enzyme
VSIAAPTHSRELVRDFSDGSVGWLESWDLAVGISGPGTRLVLSLSGCPASCLCTKTADVWHRGHRPGGEETAIEQVHELIVRAEPFIGSAGGGLTVSGAEPLQQPEFTERALRAARAAGIHTVLDSSGFLGRRAGEELLDAADLVLLDISAGTDAAHRRLTDRPLAPTLEFAQRLAERRQLTWLRYVLVPGVNDETDEIDSFVDIVRGLRNVQRVEIVPFQRLVSAEYLRRRIAFPLERTPPAFPGVVDAVRARMTGAGLRAY